MSKSGLHAHFKFKEELELATIETAAAIFDSEVLQPVTRAPAGLARLKSLANSLLSHLERRVFPGGVFLPRSLRNSTCTPARRAIGSSRCSTRGSHNCGSASLTRRPLV